MARYIAFFVLLVWATLPPTPAEAGTYRWVDANGVVHYSDRPPPQSAPAPDTPAPAGPARPPGAKPKASDAPPVTARGAPVNCGQNFDCLIRHARSCMPARMVKTEDMTGPMLAFAGLAMMKSTTQYNIEGPQAGACRFSQRALDVRVKLDEESRAKLRADGQTNVQIAEMERTWLEKLGAEGQDRMTCDLPVNRLLEILAAIGRGGIDFNSQDNCRYGE